MAVDSDPSDFTIPFLHTNYPIVSRNGEGVVTRRTNYELYRNWIEIQEQFRRLAIGGAGEFYHFVVDHALAENDLTTNTYISFTEGFANVAVPSNGHMRVFLKTAPSGTGTYTESCAIPTALTDLFIKGANPGSAISTDGSDEGDYQMTTLTFTNVATTDFLTIEHMHLRNLTWAGGIKAIHSRVGRSLLGEGLSIGSGIQSYFVNSIIFFTSQAWIRYFIGGCLGGDASNAVTLKNTVDEEVLVRDATIAAGTISLPASTPAGDYGISSGGYVYIVGCRMTNVSISCSSTIELQIVGCSGVCIISGSFVLNYSAIVANVLGRGLVVQDGVFSTFGCSVTSTGYGMSIIGNVIHSVTGAQIVLNGGHSHDFSGNKIYGDLGGTSPCIDITCSHPHTNASILHQWNKIPSIRVAGNKLFQRVDAARTMLRCKANAAATPYRLRVVENDLLFYESGASGVHTSGSAIDAGMVAVEVGTGKVRGIISHNLIQAGTDIAQNQSSGTVQAMNNFAEAVTM